MELNRNTRYLQIAFNGDTSQVYALLPRIPKDKRIIIEAGTPYIKKYGEAGIRLIRSLWSGFIVADIKTVDGAVGEVYEACSAGANAATVIGSAPIETLNLFIETCASLNMASFIDMIGVSEPFKVLRNLKKQPTGVILHIGRDEETTKGKMIQYRNISRIKSKYDVLISAAGGVHLKEAESASFNGADIVVVNVVAPSDPWKGIKSTDVMEHIVVEFLRTID
jgi:bifunctional enzyme Fae/Hps